MVKFPVRGAESAARALMMAAIGVMAGAASFTHMHDWTMRNSPAGTPEWFGWANAVVSELMPALALLEIRRRRRLGKSLGYPLAVLVGAGLLSLSAQVAQASPSWSGRGLAALPAVGFIVLTKMVFSGLPAAAQHEQAHDGQSRDEAEPERRHDADQVVSSAAGRQVQRAVRGVDGEGRHAHRDEQQNARLVLETHPPTVAHPSQAHDRAVPVSSLAQPPARPARINGTVVNAR